MTKVIAERLSQLLHLPAHTQSFHPLPSAQMILEPCPLLLREIEKFEAILEAMAMPHDSRKLPW